MMLPLILFMMRVLLSFSFKLNSHHLCNRNWSSIFSPRTTATVLNHAKTLRIQMAFKRVIEIERSEVMLIWWFFSIKSIRCFQNSLFKYLYSKMSPSNFKFTGKTVPFPTTNIIMITLLWFFFCFISPEIYHLPFFFCPFF